MIIKTKTIEYMKMFSETEEFSDWIFFRFFLDGKAKAKKRHENDIYLLVDKKDDVVENLEKLEEILLQRKQSFEPKNVFVDIVNRSKVKNIIKQLKKHYDIDGCQCKIFDFENKAFVVLYNFSNPKLEESCKIIEDLDKEKNVQTIDNQKRQKNLSSFNLLKKFKQLIRDKK